MTHRRYSSKIIMSVSALFPSKQVKLHGGEAVEVREMAWPDALEFLRKLTAFAGSYLKPDGSFAFSMTGLADLVNSSAELSNFLILKSTDQSEAFLERLPVCSALDILDSALELNLSEEVLKRGKKLGARFQALAGKSPKPTTSTTSDSLTS